MAGLLNKETFSPLPLRASSVWADLRGFTARTTATLTYYNDHRFEIEAIFVLPLGFSFHIVEFEANIEGRYLFVDIENEAESEKKTPVYDTETRSDDQFSISIGKLSPWILIDVQVTIVSEVLWMPCRSGLSFALPGLFTPKIVSDASKIDEIYGKDRRPMRYGTNCRAVSTLGYSLQININIEAPCLLSRVTSDTYPISIETLPEEDNSSRLRVRLSETFKHVDDDFSLTLYLAKPHEPFIYIEPARHTHTNEFAEKNPISNIMNNPVLMLSYSPNLNSLPKDDAGYVSELIFMIDRSGSMNGSLINIAKETILLFLHSLPSNTYFNVISFGTYFQSLFKESQPYSNANLEEACHYVRKIRADMGGTSLFEPLDWVFSKPLRKAVPRQIFMVTDGVITDAAKVIDCVRKHGHLTRIFTFGLGADICQAFLKELSQVTHGRWDFIPSGERLQPKVMERMQIALQPAVTNLRASWILPDGYDVIYTPEHIAPLFHGDRLTLYAILARRRDIEAASNGKRSRRTSSESVKEFWFEEDEFEVELICDDMSNKDILSKSHSTSSDSSSHNSAVCNRADPEDLRHSQDAEDYNDSEVFLTEEEAERLTEASNWQHGKRSSIDRVQCWKVSRHPDSVEPAPIYDSQWKSTERLTSDSLRGKCEAFSASTGDIRSHYIASREGGSQDHGVEGLPKYLAHPGYPTRHNSARSNEGRSPVQKSCTEVPHWELLTSMDSVKGGEYSTTGVKRKVSDDRRSEKSLEMSFSKLRSSDSEVFDGSSDSNTSHSKFLSSFVDDRMDMKGYDLASLRKEARRLKQTLVDSHVNTHFIDESNCKIIGKMLDVLVLDKRRRLVDYLLQQEEFVKCCWDREHEKYKQSKLESLNRRDSGLGNRSSSEPKSDHEDDVLTSMVCSRLDPVRGNNGLVSKSSSGYFEQEKSIEERFIIGSKPDLYKRQFSDECHSDRSPKSARSFGRTHSSFEIEAQGDYNGNRFSQHDLIGTGFSERARSVASDGASAKSYRTSSLSNENVADSTNIEMQQHAGPKRDFRLSASSEHIYRTKSQDRVASRISDDATLMRQRTERSIGDRSVSEEGQVSSGSRTPGLKHSQNRSVFSSFIDGVRNLASRLSERADSVSSKEAKSKSTIKGIFSRQSTGENKSTNREAIEKQFSNQDVDGKLSRNGTIKSDGAAPDDYINLKRRQLRSIGKTTTEISLDKNSEELQIKRQSSMKYTRPLLERSRTISSSFVHDLGDGEEISGDNMTLNPNEGMIYLTGYTGRRIFKRLIPFKLALNQGNDSEKSNEPTIHQLAAKSIIHDLEQQLEENTSLNMDGKEYITTLIGEVSRSAKVTSKYSMLVVIDDRCKEGEAVCIKRFSKQKGRLLSQRSIKSISSENQGDSPPMYEIQRKEVKQIEIGNRTHKIMTTKFTLFTPKPPENQSLLSPVSASRHTLLVQKRLFESSGYMVMVDIQYSDGYWTLNEDLADVIPTHLVKLKQSCPFLDPTFDLSNDKEVNKGLELLETYEKIWATSIALKWLMRRWSQYKNEWELILQKAQRWLRSQRLPSGFNLDDVNLMAQQTLGVLLSNSRKSSNQ